MRKSGILMHISSLPSEFGIGKLGDSAYMFANFLRDCGFCCAFPHSAFAASPQNGSACRHKSAAIDFPKLRETLHKACA